MTKIAITTLLLALAVTVNAFSAVPKTATRTMIHKDIKTPDPVPFDGQQDALSVMQSGKMYRYNIAKGEESIVSKCEVEIAEFTGHKYCVALNSCGSALMLLLKTSGLKPGGKVISNAFTFGAVPSAIEHAGGKAVYVESDYNHVMDVKDLEEKLVSNPDCKHVMVSHMRGKLADMNAISSLCKKFDAILLEDCAHSLGVRWEDKHSGHVGTACAISSQSYKMINSGEGGFFLTNNALMAAKCAVYAGAYEGLSSKHIAVPGPEVFGDLPNRLPNYSLRMSNLAAAVIRPQIKTLGERVEIYNRRYARLKAALEANIGEFISIPEDTPGVSTAVHDSIQINLRQSFTDEQVHQIIDECATHGLAIELFGHESNARNFVNWKFAPAEDPLPKTAKMLSRAIDCRMPLMWDDSDFDDMADVISEAVLAVI